MQSYEPFPQSSDDLRIDPLLVVRFARGGDSNPCPSGDRFFGGEQASDVRSDLLHKRPVVTHKGGLIVNYTDFHSIVDQAPEPVAHPKFLLNREVAEIVWQTRTVSGEVPAGGGPVSACGIDAVPP